jgi:Zn finger protein HypA/HybF involved in hydrogenase expression
MKSSFNELPLNIELTTFRCSACGKQFQVVILHQAEAECPHCHAIYVRVRDEWQSKKWIDFLVEKQRERLSR